MDHISESGLWNIDTWIFSLAAVHNNCSLHLKANQASLQERVDFLEKLLGESSQKHSEACWQGCHFRCSTTSCFDLLRWKGLRAAHANMERIHGSFQEQMSSRPVRVRRLQNSAGSITKASPVQDGQVARKRSGEAGAPGEAARGLRHVLVWKRRKQSAMAYTGSALCAISVQGSGRPTSDAQRTGRQADF